MPQEISRRQFNRAAAALPLICFPIAGSDVSKQRLQVQWHRISVDGRYLDGDDWRLTFWIRVVQRREGDPRYWFGRFMVPTIEFVGRLDDHGIQVERERSAKWLVTERTTLVGGVAGLCCLLEAVFRPDQQDDLWVDPTPERWGDYTVPDKKIIKRFWVSEACPM